ncbi:FHA domain-containing protein [Ketobacter sp. MCCC 1A13808]|nr:FHA domain-containing protein [Ketobacter sp. MCCC 1A13808]RLP55620.1 MAG: FHA domain-containing protein [Ketobacter sp.]
MSLKNVRNNQLKDAKSIQMRDSGFLLRSLQDGTEIPLDQRSALVGRELECEISLDSGHISRYHAKLTLLDEGIQVEDLNSTNGTFVNGTRINRTEILLPGDEIRFHEMAFKLISAQDDGISDVMLIDSMSYPESQLSDSGFSDFNFSEDYDQDLFGAAEQDPSGAEREQKRAKEAQNKNDPSRGQSARARKKAQQNKAPPRADQTSQPDRSGNSSPNSSGQKAPGQKPSPAAEVKITEAKLEDARRKAAQLAAARANAGIIMDLPEGQESLAQSRPKPIDVTEQPQKPKAEEFKAPPGFARSRDFDKEDMGYPDLSVHLTQMPDQQEPSKKISTAELLVKLNQNKANAPQSRAPETPRRAVDDTNELAALMPELRRAQQKAAQHERKPEPPKPAPEPVNPFAGLLEDEEDDAPAPVSRKPPPANKAPAKPVKNAKTANTGKGNRIEPNFDDGADLMDMDDMSLLQDRAERMVTSPDNGSGPRMVMLTAPVRGKVFSLIAKNKNTWTIGRGQEADFRILDKTVSPSHARIRKLGSDWVLEAAEGQNPIAINNRPAEFSTLQPGDVIRIGRMEMIFRVDQKSITPVKKEPVFLASGLNLGLLIGALVILGVTLGVLLV